MKDLFLLSGLGADKRVFDVLDLSNYNAHFIQWIDPNDNEPIDAYAKRLTVNIEKKNPILIGVSFGGIMAIEIGKQIQAEKIIIISSATTKHSIPTSFIARKLKLHTLLPARFLRKPNQVLFWLFGIKSKNERALLRAIMKDTDEKFFRWAIDKIMTWDNQVLLNNTIHIHGSKDRVIPFTSADYRIEGGGHLMIVNRAAEINKVLAAVI